jgi:hypothetical protein
MKVIIFLSFICVFSVFQNSCMNSNEPKCILRPFTISENKFIDSLITHCDSIELIRWNNQACDWMNDGNYDVYFNGMYVDKQLYEVDSLRIEANKIAVHLFKNVIEDSILYKTPLLKIIYYSKDNPRTGEHSNLEFDYSPAHNYYVYKKSDLENYCGFKVCVNDGVFSRKYHEVSSDSILKSKANHYPR